MGDLRDINIDGQGHLILTFKIEETAGVYALTEDDIGKPAALTGTRPMGMIR